MSQNDLKCLLNLSDVHVTGHKSVTEFIFHRQHNLHMIQTVKSKIVQKMRL